MHRLSIRYRFVSALAALLAAASLAGCSERADAAAQTPPPCDPPARVAVLPADIVEASGIVFSPTHQGVLWVHNDSDDYLYALGRDGSLRRRVLLAGPRPRDWEDIAVGPCGPAGGSCLYLADIGDNLNHRAGVTVLRIPEPSLADTITATPERFEFSYADGPRDAEAMFLLGGRIHIVSKGRNGPIALYRAPAVLRAAPMVLERVRTITDGLVQIPDQVTGADATAAGDRVVLRTYRYLDLYRAHHDTLAATATERVQLAELAEPQGEGVALNAEGEIYLVSEKSFFGPGYLSYLRCRLR